MPENKKLEDIAKTAPENAEAKNSDSSENLEGKVSRGLGSRLWGFTKVAGTTGIAAAIGGMGAAAMMGGYMTADLFFKSNEFKKNPGKRTAETIHQANIGSALSKGYFTVTNSIDNVIGKGAATIALVTPFNMLFVPAAYAIENYKMGEFAKKMITHPYRTMKDIYDNSYKNGAVWNGIKESYKWLTLPLLATAYFVPATLQLASTAVIGFIYKTVLSLGGKKKKGQEEAKPGEEKTPANAEKSIPLNSAYGGLSQPGYAPNAPQQRPYRRAA